LRKSLQRGALLGALLTAPLIAIWYFGWTLLDLPFAPFDLFDGLTRALPGPAATRAIDLLIAAGRVLHMSPAGSSKAAEQWIAIGSILAAGTVTGALLLALLSLSGEPATLLGAVVGGAFGGLATLEEHDLNRLASPGAGAAGAWVFTTFLLWGVAFGWLCDRLRASADEDASDSSPRSDRRQLLGRLGTLAAIVTGLGTAWSVLFETPREEADGDRWSASHPLPNAASPVAPAPGTRSEFTPIERHYRIDIDTRPPALNAGRWRLSVGGLVEQPLALGIDHLRSFEPTHQFVTLCCTSNPIGGDLISTTRWTGVSLQHLVPRLRLGPSVSHLKIGSADGFTEVVSLATIMADERVMLAYAWDGVPLPIEHGYPLRLFVPDLYGMKQPKWIQTIDALDHWEPGYWVQRGWDRDGHVRSTAAVDAIDGALAAGSDGGRLVPAGGIAYAGARGVSKVEVQVDGGEWVQARIREPLSKTSWAVWRADLPLAAGDRELAVRCYEGDGTPQTTPPHTRRAKV
jgi:DMSO/TMAO reductase YedYZ molybdopterin-dependent catalytic subunit